MTSHPLGFTKRRLGLRVATIALVASAGSCASELDEHAGEPGYAQVASGAVQPPAGVTVEPATIRPEQSFTVRWTPSTTTPAPIYRVVLRAPVSAGSTLLWISPEINGRLVSYNGPPLRPAGAYQVEVVARVNDEEARSAPFVLQVVDPGAAPPVPSTPAPSTPTSPASSANPTVPSRLPTWAQPLLGSYAVRTDAFSQSPLGPMLGDRQLALAEFVEKDGALELRTRLCSKRTSSLGLTVYLASPESFPEQRQKVVLANGGWSTEPATFAAGYERQGYPACSGKRGQRVTKRPEQTWIRAPTCVCYASGDEPSYDDCRVTDPDRDGAPGLAYKYSGSPDVESWVAHSAVVSRSRYVSGKIDPNGDHYGALKIDEATFYLACEPSGCNLPSVSRPCTSDYNGSQFHRLPAPPPGQASWTCESVIDQQSTLFTGPTSPTPSRCTRDDVTSAP